MTLKQFENQYPEYTGFIFLNGGFFLDQKVKDNLKLIGIKYLEFRLDFMDNSFLKIIQPNIGPNLVYFKNGNFVTKIERLETFDNFHKFIQDCENGLI